MIYLFILTISKLNKSHIDPLITKCITLRIRSIIHTSDITMNFFRVNDDNLDLRIEYMLHNLTEDNFKKKIQYREKHNNKK